MATESNVETFLYAFTIGKDCVFDVRVLDGMLIYVNADGTLGCGSELPEGATELGRAIKAPESAGAAEQAAPKKSKAPESADAAEQAALTKRKAPESGTAAEQAAPKKKKRATDKPSNAFVFKWNECMTGYTLTTRSLHNVVTYEPHETRPKSWVFFYDKPRQPWSIIIPIRLEELGYALRGETTFKQCLDDNAKLLVVEDALKVIHRADICNYVTKDDVSAMQSALERMTKSAEYVSANAIGKSMLDAHRLQSQIVLTGERIVARASEDAYMEEYPLLDKVFGPYRTELLSVEKLLYESKNPSIDEERLAKCRNLLAVVLHHIEYKDNRAEQLLRTCYPFLAKDSAALQATCLGFVKERMPDVAALLDAGAPAAAAAAAARKTGE